jgi:hypothetical protein
MPRVFFIPALIAASLVVHPCLGLPPIHRDDGPAITLPRSEIAQIERIIAAHPEIHKPLRRITLHDDGYAECHSVVYRVGRDLFVTSFDLVRRGGNWSLDAKTLRQVKCELIE